MPYKERGCWRGQVVKNGVKHRKEFATKAEAAEWEIAERKRLRKREIAEEKGLITTGTDLVNFAESYIQHAELRFGSRTFDKKRRACMRLLEFLRNVSVSDITAGLIDQFLSNQAKERGSSVSNETRKDLLAWWNWGQTFMDVTANPVAKTRPLPHDRAPQYTPPTADVLAVLAAATRPERVMLSAYLQTGARRSEVFRWLWHEDINFEKREVRLSTRKTRDGSLSHEWLPMSDELYDDLWWWWKNRPIKDTPWVFVSTSNRHYGRPFTTRRRFMKGLCTRAGVKTFEFHALRRYVASVLADTHKVSAKTIQRILRHKNVTTTERYIQNINVDLGATMNLLSRTPEEPPKVKEEKS